jgi:hypothetical protein
VLVYSAPRDRSRDSSTYGPFEIERRTKFSIQRRHVVLTFKLESWTVACPLPSIRLCYALVIFTKGSHNSDTVGPVSLVQIILQNNSMLTYRVFKSASTLADQHMTLFFFSFSCRSLS